MQIVDAQIHVWGSGLPSNLAHRQVTAFTTEEAVGLMDEGGVDAAVIHPPSWDPGATAMAFAADVLGHRHHEDAVFLAAVRDNVHRGAAVAVRAG